MCYSVCVCVYLLCSVYLCDDSGQAGLVEAFMVCIRLLVSLPVLQLHLQSFVHRLRHTSVTATTHTHTLTACAQCDNTGTIMPLCITNKCLKSLKYEKKLSFYCSVHIAQPYNWPQLPFYYQKYTNIRLIQQILYKKLKVKHSLKKTCESHIQSLS